MASAKLGTKASGTIVKLNEGGIPVGYRIVQQGKPSSGNYDDSCNGTWVRRKDITVTDSGIPAMLTTTRTVPT